MRYLAFSALAVLSLTACEPQVPDSGAGVGFGNYNDYAYKQQAARAAREAQLRNSATVRSPEETGAPSPTASATGVNSADLAAAGIGGAGTAPGSAQSNLITPATGAPLAATAAGAAYVAGNNPSISDEQSFNAVSGRQSIQSDSERLAQQRAQYQAVEPTAVPQRPGNAGPDIVAYALQTSNPVGQPLYKRTLPSQKKAQRKCAKYPSPDHAQRAFLEVGGPQKDRFGIDPDGDGFACSWNPEPFRRAVRG